MNDESSTLANRLHVALRQLIDNTYPSIPNPPNCKKRASVALVLRIRPAYSFPPVYDPRFCGNTVLSVQERLRNFFGQSWVQQGEPELLFIKRASRDGDRWAGHVALPGGKREQGDPDDRAVSVRETREETGLELDIDHCVCIGNLPERIVSTTWGKIPLMVLCPFVYLLMRHDIKPLSLQPSEVSSAHWVPLRNLFVPSSETYVRCDIAERLTRHQGYIKQVMLRLLMGQMLFPAILLGPTESLHSMAVFHMPSDTDMASAPLVQFGFNFHMPIPTSKAKTQPPLLLWGLTLGIVQDFLSRFTQYNTSGLGVWPTFSHWDIRLMLWLMTYTFRSQRLNQIKADYDGQTYLAKGTIIEKGHTSAVDADEQLRQSMRSLQSISMHLIDGYFCRVRKSIMAIWVFRVGIASFLATRLAHRYKLCS